jgi:hypothetical protein
MSPEAPGASVDGVDTFDELLARWIEAEARGDAGALDALLHVDFHGDSPRGSVLAKPEWLDRYRRGDLVHRAFAWEATRVRAHADTVFVRGIQVQEARYRGEDCSGRFLATLMAVHQDHRWTIVNLQLSRLDDAGAAGRATSASPAASATGGPDIGQVADVAEER